MTGLPPKCPRGHVAFVHHQGRDWWVQCDILYCASGPRRRTERDAILAWQMMIGTTRRQRKP